MPPRLLTLTAWKNFANGHCNYVHSPRLRYTALQYLHESDCDIDTLTDWFKDNIEIGLRDCEFNPYHYIDELENIRMERQNKRRAK